MKLLGFLMFLAVHFCTLLEHKVLSKVLSLFVLPLVVLRSGNADKSADQSANDGRHLRHNFTVAPTKDFIKAHKGSCASRDANHNDPLEYIINAIWENQRNHSFTGGRKPPSFFIFW